MFGFVQLSTSILLALLPNCKMNSCDAPIVLASGQSHESGRVFPQAVLTGLTGFLISRELTSCAFTRLDKSQGGMLNGIFRRQEVTTVVTSAPKAAHFRRSRNQETA